MCGIAGTLIFKGTNSEVDAALLARMASAISHRGPDGEGQWLEPGRKIGFAHRRLAIIDLSAPAAQPMSNEDGSLWIVYNGEIYNHAEIRAELEACGHIWKTHHSDTEVILHAFEQWGIDCIERFRGMFAIALWDSGARKLWLIRDRIGIKPIYYSLHHGRISFASEIKALLLDPQQARAIDEEALYHYLSFLAAPAPHTLFAGIQKVPAATWLCINDAGEITEHRYWEVWDHVTDLSRSREEEVAERLLAELRTAVQLRKISDVPVGVFLSGGLDSSINTALFSEGEPLPVKTFTVGYDREYPTYPNELRFARRMADYCGSEHHERILSQGDLIDFLPRMVYLQDEPLADPVCVPFYYLSQLARQHGVTVCHAGEGSDELFCGYSSWKTLLQLQKWDDLPSPLFVKKWAMNSLDAGGQGKSFQYEFLRRSVNDQPIFWGGAEAFTETHKKRLLSARMRKRFETCDSWDALQPIRNRFEAKAEFASNLNWMSYLDLNLRLPDLLLMRVDKMSMGVSLEGRVPFLDHKFVEFAMSIPVAMKLRKGETKHILKKAVAGVVPDDLIHRRKQGFGAPVYEWFFEELGTLARTKIETFCQQTDLFDASEVELLFQRGDAKHVWRLMNLAMWWEQSIAEFSAGDNLPPAQAPAFTG